MWHKIAIIVISTLIFILVLYSKNSEVGSDPSGTLLTSQSIIEHHTIKLDKYKDLKKYDYKVHTKNGHYYYYFPLGTSISSIPFVYVATKVFSLDMNTKQDSDLQKIIAAFMAVCIFLILLKIAKLYFDTKTSLILASVFWFGTSFSSTLGQALWSQVFATFYALFALYLALTIKGSDTKKWLILGSVLFLAYLTRPTMSLLIVSVLLYLFFTDRKKIAVKTAAVVAILVGFFILFSLYEYGQYLPDYYMPKRLNGDTFWLALYGNLFSPSRGILIFSPFLLLFFINIDKVYFLFKRNKALLVFAGWIVLHLIIISKFPIWWGGVCYGPRFMTDILPAIYILFIFLAYDLYRQLKVFRLRVNIAIFFILAIISIHFNVYQGLYNPWSSHWNRNPDVGYYPEYLFSWKYPQFNMNKQKYYDRQKEYKSLKKMMFGSKKIIYVSGWHQPEENRIWSKGLYSETAFKLEKNDYKGILLIDAIPVSKQRVKIYINDIFIKEIILKEFYTMKIFFNANILKADQYNLIKFEYSNPYSFSDKYQIISAMALKSLSLI